jgi:hypothetical protein
LLLAGQRYVVDITLSVTNAMSKQYGDIVQTHWFHTVWPFIGVGGAIVMFAILLTTDTFRSSTTVSRWRDPAWLAWLGVPLYWVHQFEEYSLPVIGIDYSIQEMICEKIGFPPYPDCPIPLAFYPVVNIALMWFGAPPEPSLMCCFSSATGFSRPG